MRGYLCPDGSYSVPNFFGESSVPLVCSLRNGKLTTGSEEQESPPRSSEEDDKCVPDVYVQFQCTFSSLVRKLPGSGQESAFWSLASSALGRRKEHWRI